MQEELLNYNEIIAYFTEETITERFKYLYDKMQEYEKQMGSYAFAKEEIWESLGMEQEIIK